MDDFDALEFPGRPAPPAVCRLGSLDFFRRSFCGCRVRIILAAVGFRLVEEETLPGGRFGHSFALGAEQHALQCFKIIFCRLQFLSLFCDGGGLISYDCITLSNDCITIGHGAAQLSVLSFKLIDECFFFYY